jgi:hypothetical protein
MERNVRYFADYPAIMARSDMEKFACSHLDDTTVIHSGDRFPGNDPAYVFYVTAFLPESVTNVG